MMMKRPIKFSLLPTSSPVAVFLLHLQEANPRLCAASNNDLVIYCQFVWSCNEMFHLQKTILIFTQLNQTWVIELFLGYFVFSFNVRSLALFFFSSFECLRPCLVHRASSMLLLPADQNTGWSPLTYINTISQIFRKTYVFAFKDLSVFAIASIFEQHQFQACWQVSFLFNTKPGGKVKMCWMTRINKSKHRLKMFNMCHM